MTSDHPLTETKYPTFRKINFSSKEKILEEKEIRRQNYNFSASIFTDFKSNIVNLHAFFAAISGYEIHSQFLL